MKVHLVIQGPKGTVDGIFKFNTIVVPNYATRQVNEFGRLAYLSANVSGIYDSRPDYDLLLRPTAARINSSFGVYRPNKIEELFGNHGVYIRAEIAAKDEFDELPEDKAILKVTAFQEEQVALASKS